MIASEVAYAHGWRDPAGVSGVASTYACVNRKLVCAIMKQSTSQWCVPVYQMCH